MLQTLDTILKALPNLMTNKDDWKSLYVDYEYPHVKRIWRQYGDIRINLHKILPNTKQPFYHPHPWPSSMIILKGKYEMGLGLDNKEPQIISTFILNENSKYEMTNKYAWHYIKPLEEPVYSVMISGKPWKNVTMTSNNPSLEPLRDDIFNDLFEEFTRLIEEYIIST